MQGFRESVDNIISGYTKTRTYQKKAYVARKRERERERGKNGLGDWKPQQQPQPWPRWRRRQGRRMRQWRLGPLLIGYKGIIEVILGL